MNSCTNSPEDGPVGPKHVEMQQYTNKIETVTSVGFYSMYKLLLRVTQIVVTRDIQTVTCDIQTVVTRDIQIVVTRDTQTVVTRDKMLLRVTNCCYACHTNCCYA